jgi:hypothetical protein
MPQTPAPGTRRRQNDRQVVEHGRGGGRDKVLRGVERPHDQARWRQKPPYPSSIPLHQRRRQQLLFRREAGRQDRTHKRLGKNGGHYAQCHQRQRDEIEHAAKEQPCRALVRLEPVAGKDRDERAAQRTAGGKLEEQIGNAECGEIGVIRRRSAVAGADDDLTRQPRNAAEHEEKHHQQRGAGTCAGCRDRPAHLRSIRCCPDALCSQVAIIHADRVYGDWQP